MNATQIHVARWLSDTPIYHDAAEIIAEKARRFWWGQQIDLAMIPWSMLLAVEGRRRHVPFLWAYLALAHMVNLSFAQNLFYVALLLTPAPIARVDVAPTTRSVFKSNTTGIMLMFIDWARLGTGCSRASRTAGAPMRLSHSVSLA